jgi:hypothetical protein
MVTIAVTTTPTRAQVAHSGHSIMFFMGWDNVHATRAFTPAAICTRVVVRADRSSLASAMGRRLSRQLWVENGPRSKNVLAR